MNHPAGAESPAAAVDDDPAGGLPDPTSFPAYVPETVAEFGWQSSGYVRTILSSYGELIVNGDGTVSHNTGPMLERLEGIIRDRLVTADNLDRAAYLGIDRNDLMTVLYGRPAAEIIEYREECDYLVGTAWGTLSPKGAIAKRLDHGVMLVQSPKDTLSRIVTNDDGTQGIHPVVVRMATTVPENVLNYALSPAGTAAIAAVRKAIRVAKDGIQNFPEAAELFGNRLMLLNNELNSAMADGLEKAGYVLQPGKVATTGALVAGPSKRSSSKNGSEDTDQARDSA